MESALIPTNGVHITEGQYPSGFYVAKYDAEGFTSSPRWFPTKEMAETYAASISEDCVEHDCPYFSRKKVSHCGCAR